MSQTSSITKTVSSSPDVPPNAKIGDFIVARYFSSRWGNFLPWEHWHHAALISGLNPLTVIEAVGPNTKNQKAGPAERTFAESVGFGSANGILSLAWLRPKFPDPLRAVDPTIKKTADLLIITETEARDRAVAYARAQVSQDEEYSIDASKWDEDLAIGVQKLFSYRKGTLFGRL